MIIENIKYLIYNLDLLQKVFYTSELVYGGLGLALLIQYLFPGLLKVAPSLCKPRRLFLVITLILALQSIAVQIDNSGVVFVLIMLAAALYITVFSYTQAFGKSSPAAAFAITSLNPQLDYKAFIVKSMIRAGLPNFLRANHLKFLLITLLAESFNEIAFGMSALMKNVIHYNDPLLFLTALVLIAVPFAVVDLILFIILKRNFFPQEYF